jgi:hypothetical protein
MLKGSSKIVTVIERSINDVADELPPIPYGLSVPFVASSKDVLGVTLTNVQDVVMEASFEVIKHGTPTPITDSLAVVIVQAAPRYEAFLNQVLGYIELFEQL